MCAYERCSVYVSVRTWARVCVERWRVFGGAPFVFWWQPQPSNIASHHEGWNAPCVHPLDACRTVVFFGFCLFLIWNTKRLTKLVRAKATSLLHDRLAHK